jgi:hypothetical protein
MKNKKTCSHCGATLPLSRFNKDASRVDGRSYICREDQKKLYDLRNRVKKLKTLKVSDVEIAIEAGSVVSRANKSRPVGTIFFSKAMAGYYRWDGENWVPCDDFKTTIDALRPVRLWNIIPTRRKQPHIEDHLL